MGGHFVRGGSLQADSEGMRVLMQQYVSVWLCLCLCLYLSSMFVGACVSVSVSVLCVFILACVGRESNGATVNKKQKQKQKHPGAEPRHQRAAVLHGGQHGPSQRMVELRAGAIPAAGWRQPLRQGLEGFEDE